MKRKGRERLEKLCSWNAESLTFHDSHHAPLRSNSVCVEKERKEEKEEEEKNDFHIAVLYIRFIKKKKKKEPVRMERWSARSIISEIIVLRYSTRRGFPLVKFNAAAISNSGARNGRKKEREREGGGCSTHDAVKRRGCVAERSKGEERRGVIG